MREPIRSDSIPKLYSQRDLCLYNARCAESKWLREQYVSIARQINRNIIRSDIRARIRLESLRDVLASLE